MQDFDTITENDAAELGYDAGVEGKRYSTNPYDRLTETDMYSAWGAGWEQGHAVRNEVMADA